MYLVLVPRALQISIRPFGTSDLKIAEAPRMSVRQDGDRCIVNWPVKFVFYAPTSPSLSAGFLDTKAGGESYCDLLNVF